MFRGRVKKATLSRSGTPEWRTREETLQSFRPRSSMEIEQSKIIALIESGRACKL